MKVLDALACGLPDDRHGLRGDDRLLHGGDVSARGPRPRAARPMPGRALAARSANGPVWAEPRRATRWRAGSTGSSRTAEAARGARPARGRRRSAAASPGTRRRGGSWRWPDVRARRRPKSVAVAPPGRRPRAPARPQSPHWRGTRVSVVVPTFDRKEKLLRCLDALRAQTVLPEEFEVLVVDDGSSDGTARGPRRLRGTVHLRSFRQPNQGPGTARNLAIREARGRARALPRRRHLRRCPGCVEEHLEAHARLDDERVAVLGHVDWEPSLPRQRGHALRVRRGDAAVRLPVHPAPAVARLALLLHEQHLGQPAASSSRRRRPGSSSTPASATPRSRIPSTPSGSSGAACASSTSPEARVVHDHPMDLAGFCAREERAGRMAVVFCRKHPAATRCSRSSGSASGRRRSARSPGTRRKAGGAPALDRETDEALARTVADLEARLEAPGGGSAAGRPGGDRGALNGALRVVFDAARTRGKVREWYAGVRDERQVEAAVAALDLRPQAAADARPEVRRRPRRRRRRPRHGGHAGSGPADGRSVARPARAEVPPAGTHLRRRPASPEAPGAACRGPATAGLRRRPGGGPTGPGGSSGAR